MRTLVLLLLVLMVAEGFSEEKLKPADPESQEIVDFAHDIVPILKSQCVTCHGGRESEGDFSINTRESIIESGMIVSGDALQSHLVELITSDDPDSQMPPSDRARLTTQKVSLIRRWINQGVQWTPGYTFAINNYEPPLRPRVVEIPPARGSRNHPIDRLLDHYLTERNAPLPRIADDASFIRRVSLDLVGLLPTSDQLEVFDADQSRNQRERYIDQLLERKIAYADHWLAFFNDLFRNDYTGTGFITGGRKQISDWLYRSLIENKPFDAMTRELIAPETMASRGFIDGIKWRGNVSAGQTLEIQFAQSVSQSFLGINMKCASCHDSFIDRWTLKDAYGLGAIYAEKPLELHRCDKPIGVTQKASFLFDELGDIDADASRDERLQQLARLMTHPQNGRFARTIVNRLWHRLMGHGIVHPLDAMQTEPWSEDLLDFLANEFVRQQYDLKSLLRLIVTSSHYQAQSVTEGKSDDDGIFRYRGPITKRMTAEQFLDSVWQLTGSAPNVYDAPVFRFDTSAEEIANVDSTAKWIWAKSDTHSPPDAGEELLLRKTIEIPSNVVGGGVVITCDNTFKLYINNREVASGSDWQQPQSVSLKNRLRKGDNTIVASVKNGGNPGQPNAAGFFFDANLVFEDESTLSIVSDETWTSNENVPDVKEGRLRPPKDGWKTAAVVPTLPIWQRFIDERGKPRIAMIRRSIESGSSGVHMVRASLLKNTRLMQSLGRPIRDQIVSMRPTEITTLEAIDLSNEQSLADAFADGSRLWMERSFESDADLIGELFRTTLCRYPTPAEKELVQSHLDAESEQERIDALSDLLWSICVSPEFILIR